MYDHSVSSCMTVVYHHVWGVHQAYGHHSPMCYGGQRCKLGGDGSCGSAECMVCRGQAEPRGTPCALDILCAARVTPSLLLLPVLHQLEDQLADLHHAGHSMHSAACTSVDGHATALTLTCSDLRVVRSRRRGKLRITCMPCRDSKQPSRQATVHALCCLVDAGKQDLTPCE
jgi:hypothetical protein